MLISRSVWRKSFATVLVVLGFVSLYKVTIFDARKGAEAALLRESTARPSPGARLLFNATAYCKGDVTASGVSPRRGVAASDPDLLPVGSVIELQTGDMRYDGIYSILDTGPAVQGRHVDLYMWSCYDALDFGRRPVHLTVLRLGWNPNKESFRAGPDADAASLVADPN